MNYYISDTHFGHGNIIRFTHRPFANVKEMNSVIIRNWNQTVTNNDTVYFLGDFSLTSPRETQEILYQLNGEIVLIKGNHEKSALKREYCRNRFKSIHDYLEIEDNNKMVCLFHYPIESWRNKSRGSIHLHGHIHRKDIEPINNTKNKFNVNVEFINYRPTTINELINEYKSNKQLDLFS